MTCWPKSIHGDHKDFDGRELALEMNNFPVLPKAGMTAMEILNHLKEKKLEVFPNMWVALRIAVTLRVTVASAERSFSKLKLLKTYLRSTMSQARLNGLALMSVNQESQVRYHLMMPSTHLPLGSLELSNSNAASLLKVNRIARYNCTFVCRVCS